MEPEQERLHQEKKKEEEKDIIIKFTADHEPEKSGSKQI